MHQVQKVQMLEDGLMEVKVVRIPVCYLKLNMMQVVVEAVQHLYF